MPLCFPTYIPSPNKCPFAEDSLKTDLKGTQREAGLECRVWKAATHAPLPRQGFLLGHRPFWSLHQEKYARIRQQWQFTVKQKIPLGEKTKQKHITFQTSKKWEFKRPNYCFPSQCDGRNHISSDNHSNVTKPLKHLLWAQSVPHMSDVRVNAHYRFCIRTGCIQKSRYHVIASMSLKNQILIEAIVCS